MRGVRYIRFTAETVKIGSKADDVDAADVSQILHMAHHIHEESSAGSYAAQSVLQKSREDGSKCKSGVYQGIDSNNPYQSDENLYQLSSEEWYAKRSNEIRCIFLS